MPRALKTRADLEHKLIDARAAVVLAEDSGWYERAAEARAECDEYLDALLHLPEARDSA